MRRTDTDVTEAPDLLGPGDVGAVERGVPETRWNVAANPRPAGVGLLGRLHYYGSWVDHLDARSVRCAEAPVLSGCFILYLDAAVALTRAGTPAVGGQNVLDTYSDRMELFAACFSLACSQSTPGGFSGGTTRRASATAGGGSGPWGARQCAIC